MMHIGITVTDLRYEQSSLSIICSTTGGPVTTIAWKKDGKRLIVDGSTYQSSQVILDAGTARYQNILSFTIPKSESLSGLYTCQVENMRGNSSSQLTVTGKDFCIAT